MRIWIANAFALSMLDRATQKDRDGARIPRPLDDPRGWLDGAPADAEIVSCVGHIDVARLYSRVLGCDIATNRVNIALARGDMLLVGQYVGPRLPEGATALPEGARIEWWVV